VVGVEGMIRINVPFSIIDMSQTEQLSND
jgi:hypothetical protein